MLGEMDILLLLRIIISLVWGKCLVWLIVFKVMFLVKVLLLMMEIILKFFFLVF